jgi:hypothetical protein
LLKTGLVFPIPRSDLAATIQERAWTSSIQFVPGE